MCNLGITFSVNTYTYSTLTVNIPDNVFIDWAKAKESYSSSVMSTKATE